jgi:nitroimidazol reductase NimA-like FMN-containing flavoprotein (pyridoxamine 5'-phosphate oxidase superfamily)
MNSRYASGVLNLEICAHQDVEDASVEGHGTRRAEGLSEIILGGAALPEDPGQFRQLPQPECWRRLEAGIIGRVAWQAVDGPEVLPVTYAARDGLVIFRTSAYGPLAELRIPRPVAFEIDAFDLESRNGWSVTARGPSRTATAADTSIDRWGQEHLVPWAAGSRTLVIVIEPHTVTGRTVSAPRDSVDEEGNSTK